MVFYEEIVTKWIDAQREGSFCGRPLANRTIYENHRNLKKYWQKLKLLPSLEEIHAENLKKVVYSIRPTKSKCKFSQKANLIKAVKSFMKQLVAMKLKTKEDLQALNEIKVKQHSPVKRVKPKHRELIALLDASVTVGNYRLTAILALTGLCGLRITEALELPVSALDFKHVKIKVLGKGNKLRIIPLPPEAVGYLLHWEAVRPDDTLYLGQWTYKTATKHLNLLPIKKQIEGTWHSFRRTAATNWANSGMPLTYIQYCLGHESITTTQLYIQADEYDVFKWFYPEY